MLGRGARRPVRRVLNLHERAFGVLINTGQQRLARWSDLRILRYSVSSCFKLLASLNYTLRLSCLTRSYRLRCTVFEAIEATRLPARTPAPFTRASASRRPLTAVVRSIGVAPPRRSPRAQLPTAAQSAAPPSPLTPAHRLPRLLSRLFLLPLSPRLCLCMHARRKISGRGRASRPPRQRHIRTPVVGRTARRKARRHVISSDAPRTIEAIEATRLKLLRLLRRRVCRFLPQDPVTLGRPRVGARSVAVVRFSSERLVWSRREVAVQ